jgi:predicted nucleic-acid-binding protein
VKALDTNVLVRFLVDDDRAQGRKVRQLLESAERSGERFHVCTALLLETIWVLSAVYELEREDVVDALTSLIGLPVLEFENHESVLELVRLARTDRTDLPDLLIGLCATAAGCETTLTFEKGLTRTGLFEKL